MRVGPAQLWPDVAPQWILNLPAGLEEFCYDIYKSFIYDDRYEMYVRGLGNTLLLTLMATLMGIVLGVVIALLRSTWDKNGHALHGFSKIALRIVNILCNIYLTVIRGTPVVVQLLIMYYVVFATSKNKIMIACLSFGINSGAYVAEIVRGGIMSVDNGQFEAGRSLGFNYVQTMIHIILPQGLKSVLPALANEFIVLLKETSVSGYVALQDITKGAYIIIGRTYSPFMPLIATALVYLIMVIFFTKLVDLLERRLRNSDH